MNKNNLVLVGVALSLVLAVVAIFKAPSTGPAGRDGKDGQNVFSGSVSSTFNEPDISVGGVQQFLMSTPITIASSTACSALVTATSSLRFSSVLPTVATSTRLSLYLATSTTPSLIGPTAIASTSMLAYGEIGANKLNAVIYSPVTFIGSTGTGFTNQVSATSSATQVLTPGTYVLWGYKGGGAGTALTDYVGGTHRGNCKFMFVEL